MSKSIATASTSQGSARQPPHDFNERAPTSLPSSISNSHPDQGIPPDARIPYPFFVDQSPSRPGPTTSRDLYADLSTFTFGAATSSTPSSSHPRNSSVESDEPSYLLSDATPRPSVSAPIFNPNSESIYSRVRNGTDGASLNTFGHEGERFSSSSASVSVSSLVSDARATDSFSGTTSAASAGGLTQFSSDEYDEEDVDNISEHNPPRSYTSNDRHEDWDRLSRISRSTSGASDLYNKRRGSHPMAIPGATPPGTSPFDDDFYGSGRNRENSAATIRRPSRSLDDDLQMFHTGSTRTGTGMVGSPASGLSEPLSRGDWEVLESKNKNRDFTDGATEPLSATHGFNTDWMKELQGGITSMSFGDIAGVAAAPIPPTSSPGRRQSAQSWLGWLPGRRPSAATIGTLDDAFNRQVFRWDDIYQQRRAEWSFKRERAEDGAAVRAARASLSTTNSMTSPRGSISTEARTASIKENERAYKPKPSLTGMPRGTEELWRCEFVGRYKVHRREVRAKTPSNSMKPPQQRLDIQPFADPYVLAKVDAPHGMPVTIHKHSRALAFSIYRQRPRLPASKRPSNNRDGSSGQQSVAPARSSIMLAPKRVQEQYTSTRTTNTLDTHGLLENKGSQRAQGSDRSRDSVGTDRSSSKRDKDKKASKDDDPAFSLLGNGKKDKDKKKRTASSSTSQTSSAGSIASSREDASPPPASAPARPRIPPPMRKQPSSKSLRSSPSSSSRTLPLPPPSSPFSSSRNNGRRTIRDSNGDDSDFEDLPKSTRTPHSEAFGTMDPSIIEEQMQRAGLARPTDDSSRSFFKRITRSLQRPVVTPTGGYNPNWPLMAPRSQQEENERVVQILNDSFKGVGLLPSKPPSKSRSGRSKKSGSNSQVNIFEEVPADSLYMLLPLWPGETDPQSAQDHPCAKPRIPPEQRQYLLVYYAPFEKPQENGSKPKKDPERRSRSSQTSSFEDGYDEYGVLLTSFHCSARLVGYSDLLGSGVLAPDEGLFVTGPMSEAIAHLPSPAIRQEHQTDFVIGIHMSRDHGVEFIPEGLVKMGLCYPTATPLAEEPTVIPDEDEMPEEPVLKLTPIGRAVVEMAWLGCLALTSFGTA